MSDDVGVEEISLFEACCLVGSRRYGKEWIGELTERECWLLARYFDAVDRTRPGVITYYGPGGRIPAVNSPELLLEVEHARDRRDWMRQQYQASQTWLRDHGFISDRLSRGQLERALGTNSPPRPRAALRSSSQREIKVTMQKYLLQARGGGDNPNMDRAVEFVQERLSGAGRDAIRKVYTAEMGAVLRGRPRKKKIAEK
jgi:hypothetical protein